MELLLGIIRQFMASRSGNTAVMASLLAVPLLGMGGLALDYTYLYQTASKLQGSADAAALTTAKEMTLANADINALKSIAEAYVMSNLGDVASPETTQVDVLPAQDGTEVKVTVSHVWKPMLLHYFVDAALPIVESSVARLAGERSLCRLGLDWSMTKSIYLRKSASLEASGCAVFSNSSDRKAIVVENNAVLEAGLICAVGGIAGQKQASFEPKPVTDCPSVEDPLINRSTPPVGLCDHTTFEIKTGTHTLYPGTYCDGLKIKGSAKAYLKPGIYVIAGNKLEVTDNAVLDGENVGFYLHGHKSKIEFKKQTTIRLTAPKTGLMNSSKIVTFGKFIVISAFK